MTDRFSVMVRILWIDDVIEEDGQINRADIARAFSVSMPQASYDLKRYMAAHPGRIAYDVRAKTYAKIEGTHPLFNRGARCAAVEIVNQVQDLLNLADSAEAAR